MTTNFEGKPILSDDELKAEFAALFPHGWAGPDVMAELAPNGWAASPLVTMYHPSAAQVHEETVRMRRGLANLGPPREDAPPPEPEPTLAEIEAEHQETPVDPPLECQEIVGRCLWDVFSDNHEVFADDGRLFDLGSHRASGGFLAEVINAQDGPRPTPKPEINAMFEEMFKKGSDGSPQAEEFMAAMRKEMVGDGGYTYLDFYMGSAMTADRADLQPVYEMIFRRLHARGCHWEYHFPRLYAVDLRPLKQMLDEKKREEEGEPEFAGYDPSAAFAEEQEEQERDESLAEMREQLDEGYRESVAAAKDREPPTVVRAYRAVYGDFPQGWPPEVE